MRKFSYVLCAVVLCLVYAAPAMADIDMWVTGAIPWWNRPAASYFPQSVGVEYTEMTAGDDGSRIYAQPAGGGSLEHYLYVGAVGDWLRMGDIDDNGYHKLPPGFLYNSLASAPGARWFFAAPATGGIERWYWFAGAGIWWLEGGGPMPGSTAFVYKEIGTGIGNHRIFAQPVGGGPVHHWLLTQWGYLRMGDVPVAAGLEYNSIAGMGSGSIGFFAARPDGGIIRWVHSGAVGWYSQLYLFGPGTFTDYIPQAYPGDPNSPVYAEISSGSNNRIFAQPVGGGTVHHYTFNSKHGKWYRGTDVPVAAGLVYNSIAAMPTGEIGFYGAIMGPVEVEIDIKPGSDPNSINIGSKGVVAVAILTTEDFDAADVDETTVELAGAGALRASLEDVDGDTDVDMILHFATQDLDLILGDVEAALTGKTLGGVDIVGADSVRILEPQRGKAQGPK